MIVIDLSPTGQERGPIDLGIAERFGIVAQRNCGCADFAAALKLQWDRDKAAFLDWGEIRNENDPAGLEHHRDGSGGLVADAVGSDHAEIVRAVMKDEIRDG